MVLKKGFVFALAFVFLLSLSACTGGGKDGESPAREMFFLSGAYDITCGELSGRADVAADASSVSIVFTAPDSLTGYTLRYDGADILFDVCGLTQVDSLAASGPDSAVKALCTALLTCASGKRQRRGDAYTADGVDFSVDANGKIISLRSADGSVAAVLAG